MTRDFVRTIRVLPDVERVALIGSLASEKNFPKDADVVVTVADDANIDSLARFGRRFQGRAHGINSTADIFLASVGDEYLGRICQYRKCHPRVLCRARHCGARPHLNDDLDIVTLAPGLISAPPIVLYPTIVSTGEVPGDVESLLLAPLRNDAQMGKSDARAI